MRVPINLKSHTHQSGKILDHVISVQNDTKLNVTVDYINLENVSHKKLYLSNVNQEPIITQNLEPSNEENVL